MANELTTPSIASPSLPAAQVYVMAAICLVAGLAIGYLLRGSQPPASLAQLAVTAAPSSTRGGARGPAQMPGTQAQPAAAAGPLSPHAGAMRGRPMPSLEQMKQMADKQAAPLLDKLNADPKNGALLMQVGAIYYTTHQFKEASAYYRRAVEADPKNNPFRIKLATSLYSTGDADGAIAELNRALRNDPKDADALFDLGLIKLQGKQDSKGAVAAWQQLLKSNPQLSADRRATVQKLMANVLTTLADQHGSEGVRSNDGHK